MFGMDKESVLVYQEAVLVRKEMVSSRHEMRVTSSGPRTVHQQQQRVTVCSPAGDATSDGRTTWKTTTTTTTHSKYQHTYTPYSHQLYQVKVTYRSVGGCPFY